MENNAETPIFTKRNIIIGGIILLVLIISMIFLFSCTKKEIKTEKVEIAQANVSIQPGETFLLKANVYPENASNKDLQYISTDPTVATVDENGLITALKDGTTQIIVKSSDTDIAATCDITVTVNPNVATQIAFSESEMTIEKGAKHLLKTVITPATAKIPELMFTSSDSNVVSVDKDGYIIGNNVGVATITVIGNNGSNSITADVKITVVETVTNNNDNTDDFGNNSNNSNTKVESISINRSSVSLYEGEEYQLIASVKSGNEIPTITWNSSDPSVVTVTKTGKVKALKNGTATITATAGNKVASAKITVNKLSTDTQNNNQNNNTNNNTNTNTNTNTNNNTNTNSNSGTSNNNQAAPTITLSKSGTKGNNDWYISKVTVKANISGSNVTDSKYCITSVNSTCTPNTSVPSTGVKVGEGKWVLYFSAKNSKSKKTTTVSTKVYVDITKPECTFQVANKWETAPKTITFKAKDSGSGVYGMRYNVNNGLYGLTSKTISAYSEGEYAMTCEDVAGNKKTASVTVLSRKEYSYRVCQACAVTSTTFGAWTKKSTSCYSTNKTPTKATAESNGNTEYYECTKQSGTGNGCQIGQYYCRYYTRSIYRSRSCYEGCESGKWSEWSSYSTTVQNTVRTQYQYKEVRTRTTYNAFATDTIGE